MTDRRIIAYVADAIRTSRTASSLSEDLSEVACAAYEEAREAVPDPDQPCRFTVKGRGTFPADMLRHDHCWPVDGAINHVTYPQTSYPRVDVTVTLCAQSARRITPARWASFGWIVTDIDGLPVE
jgi:hypothetical protein